MLLSSTLTLMLYMQYSLNMWFCVHLQLSQSFHSKLSFPSFLHVFFLELLKKVFFRLIFSLKPFNNSEPAFLPFHVLSARKEELA